MFKEISEQKYSNFVAELQAKDEVSFATLGPIGTSSYNTLLALFDEVKMINKNILLNIDLKDNFDLVYDELNQNKSMYAMVPAAYERVTDFFWSPQFENVYNFTYSTPLYGLVTTCENDYKEKDSLVVASCPAVEKLFYTLKEGLAIEDIPITYLRTHSTTEAALAVVEKKADLAITNESSVQEYEKDLVFISEKLSSQMLWCIFKKRK